MKTIWKFKLESAIEMPLGSQILSAREQGDEICIWALVDPLAEKEQREFTVYGTGHDVPDAAMKFLGTAHLYGGNMVFHVFELLSE